MDRRSWPWKKKSSDKCAAATEIVASQGEQDGNKKPSYIQISFEQYSQLTSLKDEVKKYEGQVQELEDQIKDLNDKLSAADAEITAKDSLVKQHSKVAEEAVSGWEKAEAEASALKTHLESVTLSKLSAEDRAEHLDGALKECMRQVRSLKEENEQKLKDVIVSNTKQMDKVRVEFEAKVADFEQELLQAAAENDALSRSLQERSNMLIRISEEKSQAESEIEHLKSNIESCEREISSLKYELHVISKELEIRNEEKNMSMRSAEAANKQNMESVKKIVKLEAECQRLRGLVRKKLPGPAALAQMKMEVESLGRDYVDSRIRRSPVKPSSPLMSPMSQFSHISEFSLDNSQKFHKENEFLTERLLAMEEETKFLKEALAKRNNELQVSRNLCAKTANKLQSLEAQWMSKSPTRQNASNPPSLASLSEDGNEETRSLTGSWSTMAMSDLSQSNRDKSSLKINKADSVNHLELMDDFLEMEKLACLSNDSNGNGSTDISDSPNKKRSDMDDEQQPAIQLKKRISNLLQSLPKDTAIDKILAEFQFVIRDKASESHDLSGEAASRAENERMSQELVDALSRIHRFVSFLSKDSRASQDSFAEGRSFIKKIEEFSATFDKVLLDEKTLIDFLHDLSHVLAQASELKIAVLGFNVSELEIHSPDCIDKVALPEKRAIQDSSDEHDQNNCSDTLIPEDGNVISSYEPKPSPCKFTAEEFEALKMEKEKVDAELASCLESLEELKSKLGETEQQLEEVKSELESARKSNSLAETQLKCMVESYRSLETRSTELENEVNSLKESIESLEDELHEEKQGHLEASTRCQELEEQLQRNHGCPDCSSGETDQKKTQEKELEAAAEKLAECQETILLLGKQLKSLRPQAEQMEQTLNLESEISNSRCRREEDQTESETGERGSNSDKEMTVTTMKSPVSSKMAKHRHTKSSSVSGVAHEKHSRGLSRFFSSKAK
ncbi:PREDICTED: filament-like plant protein 4 [Tarenaya hassleriana]|uniref:filament-like plant protein 4 n=1 Tax=Tarenaya hassleriana TaxID=28532 RepID=UPI00053C141D|nr:PREDICTED: filament-like plant protein 4 [Tarenaya hassleriana]